MSVRNSSEAIAALAGGADLIDVKEPRRGPLGMAGPEIVAAVLHTVRNSAAGVAVSAALGETTDWTAEPQVPAVPADLAFVKLGPAGLGKLPGWESHWSNIRARFDVAAGCRLPWIGVVYADGCDAAAPSAEAIVAASIETRCAGVLFDTWNKTGRTLLNFVSVSELAAFSRRLHAAGMLTAVAGGLRADHLSAVVAAVPDVVAIRGAACGRGGRTAQVSTEAVRGFRTAMEAAFWQPAK